MNTMFDDSDGSDTEINFKTTNEYAKNYDKWRQKEVLNSLKTKYKGDLNSDEETSSSEDDDSDIELPDKVEMDFLKTLSSLKNKDPKIYDENVKFFDDTPIDPTVKKKRKEQPMFLKDYERKMLLEHGEKVFNEEEEEDENSFNRGLTYVEEQEKIKKSLKSALENVDDDDANFGGLFQTRVKTKAEKEKDEASYKQWLKGQKESLNNAEDETSLKPLKDHWNDPNLDEGEKFLRDYILNNRFKETNDPNYVPTYDEIIHDDEELTDDEANVDKQEEFEHKFNYRFEEPDQEFLKRYPRTVENSLRKTDDKRKIKRQELKERKVKEKQEKMEEIQQLKAIKRKEIEEKIKKLKEITGNTEVAFEDQDIDDDFDPEAHDKRMQALFNDEFYTGEEGDEKPEFPDLDEELEIERWDKHHKEQINKDYYDDNDGPHAEDEDFNMDCEYDPSTSTQDELIENSKGKKKRKRKSKFAKAVSETKPVFDPNDKTYEEYLDEYYKLDCEDIVGGIPCRFKYRNVAPNNFGLTIEEILTANDKELNRWCSIKKAMQYRPDHIEKYDQIAYSKKAQNEALKRKILPSLYTNEQAGTSQNLQTMTDDINKSNGTPNKKKNQKKYVNKSNETIVTEETTNESQLEVEDNLEISDNKTKTTKRKRNNSTVNIPEQNTEDISSKNTKTADKNKRNKRNNYLNNDLQELAVPKAKKMKFNQSVDHAEGATTNLQAKQEKTSVNTKKSKKTSPNKTNSQNKTKNEKTSPNKMQNKSNNANASVNGAKANGPTRKSGKKNKMAALKAKIAERKNKQTQNQGKNTSSNLNATKNKKQKKGNQAKNSNKKGANSPACGLSDARLQAFGIKPKKFKNKLKYGNI